MPHDSTEAVPLIRLVGLLRQTPGLTACELAETLAVNERSIKRYIRKLRASGVAIKSSAKGGYRLDGASVLTPVELQADEALAVVAACQSPAVHRQLAALGSLERAIAKITDQLSPQVRQEVLDSQARMMVRTAPVSDSQVVTDVYSRMRHSIQHGARLNCQYDDRTGTTKSFLFDPYALYFGMRAWYVVGLSVAKGQVRTLKLSRFVKAEPAGETYAIPPRFSLEKHFGNAWHMVKGDASYDVVIDFDASLTDTIADTHWHKTQETQLLENGGLRFTCKVDGLDEIVWWVLSMGASCKVRKPAALRMRVQREAERILERYAPRAKRTEPDGRA